MGENKPNVLLICIDCLRSDFALGDYGKKKTIFSYFERHGKVFDTVIATASVTTPAVASYMTGFYPNKHEILSLRDYVLSNEVITLAEVFCRYGYQTLAHVTGPLLEETNLDRGFTEYKYRDTNRTVYTDWWGELKGEIQNLETPWFIYLHLWEAHGPRYPPPDMVDDELIYEASVRGCSEKLEELLNLLEENKTIIAIMGDHGESIGDGTFRNKIASSTYRNKIVLSSLDTSVGQGRLKIPLPGKLLDVDYINHHLVKHLSFDEIFTPSSYFFDNYLRPRGKDSEYLFNGFRKLNKSEFPNDLRRIGHGYQIYDYLTRVPFCISGPGIHQTGRITRQVSQIDIFPTLISAAGLEPPKVAGRNLLNDEIKARPAFSRACGVGLRSNENWLYGVRFNDWKMIKGRERTLRQLFNLKSDPKELDNVADKYHRIAEDLEGLLDDFIELEVSKNNSSISEEEQTKMNQHLNDLGYI